MRLGFFVLIAVLYCGSAAGQSVHKTPRKKLVAAATKKAQSSKFDPLADPVADLKKAAAKAKASGRRIILNVGGEWCVWCHILENFLAANPYLSKQVSFVWLKINISLENENKLFLASYPVITGYPHLFVLETDGTFLHSQDTSPLESGKSYDKQRVETFLRTWAPIKPLKKTSL